MSSSDLINGSGALGFGVNIFSDLSLASLRNRIIDVAAGDRTKTIKGKTYSIPKNADLYDDSTTSGNSSVEKTRQEYEKHFDAKVKVSTKVCAFKVSGQASISEDVQSKSSTYYAVYEAAFTRYSLKLNNSAKYALYEGLTRDRDYTDLPAEFTEQNKHKFFRFFNKFGTHYLSSVTMGGRLFYSIATRDSYYYSETEIKTKIEAEYKGIFSAKAEAETAFKEANEQWFSNTQRKVYAQGGDASIINVISPSFGKNNSDVLNKWVESLEQDPAVREFTIEPISMIFEGGQAAAVEQAMRAYSGNRLQAKASARSGAILVQGRQISPEVFDKPTPRGGRIQVAIINKRSLGLECSAAFNYEPRSGGGSARYELAEKLYRDLYDKVKEYEGSKDYICIFSAVSLHNEIAPSDGLCPQFNTFLQNCGAGSKLRQWREHHAYRSGDPDERYTVDYILIGSCGNTPGKGIEAMSPFYGPVAQAMPPLPLSLYAFLEGSYDSAGNFLAYEPKDMGVQGDQLQIMSNAPATPDVYEPAALEPEAPAAALESEA